MTVTINITVTFRNDTVFLTTCIYTKYNFKRISSEFFLNLLLNYSEARLAHYLSLCKLQQRAQKGRHPLSL